MFNLEGMGCLYYIAQCSILRNMAVCVYVLQRTEYVLLLSDRGATVVRPWCDSIEENVPHRQNVNNIAMDGSVNATMISIASIVVSVC